MKERLDILLLDRKLAKSREQAKAFIMEGLVFVDEQISDKPGTKVDLDSKIVVKGDQCRYVSRGGLKLEKAIEVFKIDIKDRICVDIGASTGGFTDCMLQNGASKVYSIDVGYGQLDWKLRNDPRVVNIERCNVRYLDPDEIPDKAAFISIDVSFISLRLILPVAASLLESDGSIVALIKPQFEAGRNQVGKKGIVRDPDVHEQVIFNVMDYCTENALYLKDLSWSPVKGAKGNIEYLLYVGKTGGLKYNHYEVKGLIDQACEQLD